MLRLALLFLLALLVYSPRSDAACTEYTAINSICSTQGEAVTFAHNYVAALRAAGYGACVITTTGVVSEPTGTNDRYWIYTSSCATNVAVFFPKAAYCTALSPLSGTGDFNAAEDGDLRCFQGCRQQISETETDWTWTYTGGTCALGYDWGPAFCPSGYAWDNTFSTCVPLPPDADGDGVPDTEDAWPFDPTRTKDTDNDGIADEFDAFPSDPGENADTDGDGVGDNGDHKPDDPDNGKDDGTGNEADNTSTGGGDCKTPPNSQGDAILVQIAYQNWHERCNTEKLIDELKKTAATVVGDIGDCNQAFSCTGSGLECAKVNALRKQICGTSSGTNITVEGDFTNDLTSESYDTGTSGITAASAYTDPNGEGTELAELDTSGFLGGVGQCLDMPTVSVYDKTFDLNTIPHICEFFQAGAALVLLFGAVSAFRILSGGNA